MTSTAPAVVPEQVHEVDQRRAGEQVLHVEQDREGDPARQVTAPTDERNRQQEQPCSSEHAVLVAVRRVGSRLIRNLELRILMAGGTVVPYGHAKARSLSN